MRKEVNIKYSFCSPVSQAYFFSKYTDRISEIELLLVEKDPEFIVEKTDKTKTSKDKQTEFRRINYYISLTKDPNKLN